MNFKLKNLQENVFRKSSFKQRTTKLLCKVKVKVYKEVKANIFGGRLEITSPWLCKENCGEKLLKSYKKPKDEKMFGKKFQKHANRSVT